MANKSVAVLSSSGRKVGYKEYKAAKLDVDNDRATWESERCIRLLASSDGVEWRSRRSGGRNGGPVVRQMERLVGTEGLARS
jgi:hypothetical protein